MLKFKKLRMSKYETEKVEFLIDDENIYQYSKCVYIFNLSGIFQKPFLFKMSIKDNLSLIDIDIANQVVVMDDGAIELINSPDIIKNNSKIYKELLEFDQK